MFLLSFLSLINKQKISVGNVNFYRDLIHPSVIVKHSILTNEDLLIGSGELINVGEFIKDLYTISNLNYIDYLSFNESNSLSNSRKDYFSKIKYSNYEELLNLTYYDTKKYNISFHKRLPYYASSECSSSEFQYHLGETTDTDIFAYCPVTSPLIKVNTIEKCISSFISSNRSTH